MQHDVGCPRIAGVHAFYLALDTKLNVNANCTCWVEFVWWVYFNSYS